MTNAEHLLSEDRSVFYKEDLSLIPDHLLVQIYEAALERLASELAAVERIDTQAATEKLQGLLEAA